MAIDQHPSRLLISLVPFRPALLIVFSDMGIIISLSLLFSGQSRTLFGIGLSQRYHNILCCPSKILHKHCFQFLLGLTIAPREIEINAYANFCRDNKKYYGILKKVFRCRSAQKWNACFHTGIN